MQKAALGITVEERNDAAAALGDGEGVVVREFPCENEVGGWVAGVDDGGAGAGTDADGLYIEGFHGGVLGDGDGEAFGEADGVGDARY